MAYNTRGCKVDYKTLSDPWPKDVTTRRRRKADDELYPIEIIERDPEDATRMKIHYIGYSSSYDEWRNCGEIVDLTDQLPSLTGSSLGFSLYEQLASKVKKSLKSPRMSSPEVRIDIDFDQELYNRDMKKLGQLKEKKR